MIIPLKLLTLFDYDMEANPVKQKSRTANLVILFVLLVVSFSISLLSPVNVFMREGLNYSDQSVFMYVARIMDHGGVPYRDVFDHKGPLLYFINLVGLKINYEYGIWWIEVAAVFLSLLAAYKISRRFLNKVLSLIVTILVFAPIVGSFEYGNLPELYALPFQLISLYFFVEYFQQQTTSYLKVFLCGLSFSAVLLLKPNLLAVWVVFLLYITFSLIRKKEFRFLFGCILYFCIGLLVMTLPFIIYFGINHALGSFIQDYWIFNMIYTAEETSFFTRLSCLWSFLSIPSNLISLIILVSFCFVKTKIIDRKLNIIGLLYFIVSLIFVSVSGYSFVHYGIAIIPATVIPFIEVFDVFANRPASNAKFKKVLCISVAMVLISFHYIFIIEMYSWNTTENGKRMVVYSELNRYIDLYSKPEEPIICYGNDVLVYNFSHRFAASKYAFLPFSPFDKLFIDEYLNELESNKPPVFVQVRAPNEKIKGFLNKNNYQEIAKVDRFTIYAIAE